MKRVQVKKTTYYQGHGPSGITCKKLEPSGWNLNVDCGDVEETSHHIIYLCKTLGRRKFALFDLTYQDESLL